MKKVRTSQQILFGIVGMAVLLVSMSGVSFAFYQYRRVGGDNNVVVGRLSFEAANGTTVNLSGIVPITSVEAQTNTTNVINIPITISGDTDYNGGIEYLIKIDDVNVETTTGKKLPLALNIDVDGTLGTNETRDYYANRTSYSSNKYKIEYNGSISQNAHIIVGYIAPNTTIGTSDESSGTINIRAYIDKDKILVSDSYGDGNTYIDELGEGKVVLTQEEWNSINNNNTLNLKFNIEAHQGIWVEKPAPKIESCPECKYMYTTNTYYYGGVNNANATEVSTLIGVTNDYTTLNKNIFLGFTESNGKIDRAFACGIKGEDPNSGTVFCIEGSSDNSIYVANKTFLNTLYGPFDDRMGLGCEDESLNNTVRCHGSVQANVSADSRSAMYLCYGNTGKGCYVYNDGHFYCYNG